MIILGLTGSIGMGKSTAAEMFRRMGVPVYDSDSSVHVVLGKGGAAVKMIEASFPGVVVDGVVDRDALGELVFADDAALKTLESIVHPMVRQIQDNFLRKCAARRLPLIVLDVPLLFEVKLDKRCDASLVVSAPHFIQAARVMARPGMTREKFDGILARQLPDAMKRRRADFVVPSGRGLAATLRHLRRIARLMKKKPATRWPPNAYMTRTSQNTNSRRRVHARGRLRY